MMDHSTAARSAAIFAALSHPARLAIVELLDGKDLSVGQIAMALDLGQSSASQHLAALFRVGVLDFTPRGTSRLYRIRGPRITRIVGLVAEFCDVQGLKGEPADVHAEI